jgi:hypothetical protein
MGRFMHKKSSVGPAFFLLVMGLFQQANAASPLSANETAGLQHYCSIMYDVHKYPASQKDVYCACFMQDVPALSPVTRSMIILLGDDPDNGPATQKKMQQLAAPYSAEQKKALIAEMQNFMKTTQPKCLKTLGWRRFF